MQTVNLAIQVLHEVVGGHPGEEEADGRTDEHDDQPAGRSHAPIVSMGERGRKCARIGRSDGARESGAMQRIFDALGSLPSA